MTRHLTRVGILLAISGAPLAAQQRVLDRGSLVVSRAGGVIGKEEFTVRAGRTSGDRGWTIASEIFYPAGRGQRSLGILMEVRADSQPASLQLDMTSAGPMQVFAELGTRRITIRTNRNAQESVRQYPAPERVWLLDDSAFAIHALTPAGNPGPVVLLWPRSGTREPATWAEHGTESTELNGHEASLRHITIGGSAPRELWYDERGRLMKVEVPSKGLVAMRAER